MVFEPGRPGEEREIEDTVDALQQFVGRFHEAVVGAVAGAASA